MQFLLSENNLWILLIALVSGAMLLWPKLSIGRAKDQVTLADAIQLVNRENGVFVDVRPEEQFKAGTIPQARNLPHDTLESNLGTLPKNKPIVLVDAKGREAPRVAAQLRKHGFDQVHALQGGLDAWAQGGMPLKKY